MYQAPTGEFMSGPTASTGTALQYIRNGLRDALAGLGAGVHVEPLLQDERGNRVVPTGKVTVR